MAAWQFDVMATYGDGGTALPSALRARAAKLLAETFESSRQISNRWQIFGDKDGSCFELITSEDGGGELWMRIDARTDAESFLTCVVVLMIEMECGLFAPELGWTLPADMPSLCNALKASDAWRYALTAG